MSVRLNDVILEQFKAFHNEQSVNVSDLNIWMGANSSGKSSCLQSLLTLKQTCESGQEHIGLLLNGKYTTLGAFSDVINSAESDKGNFSITLKIGSWIDEEVSDLITVTWVFYEDAELINGVGLERVEICGNADIHNCVPIKDKSSNSHEILEGWLISQKESCKLVMYFQNKIGSLLISVLGNNFLYNDVLAQKMTYFKNT